MKKMMAIIGAGVCVSLCQLVTGETWYVDGLVSTSGNGESWATAFQTIQEGIDAASDGHTVIVAKETYVENIHFDGKNITLTSTDPLRSSVVYNTTIDGGEVGSVVTFAGTEDESCVLRGFTIMDGIAEYGGGICGGTADHHTHATIQSNSIARNTAQSGGGAAHCDGTIQNNTFIVNTAHLNGGALYDCDGTVENNTIKFNSGSCGGGIYGCDGVIRGNAVPHNSALDGGGMAYCEATIRQNGVSYNRAFYAGGGLYNCNGIIDDNSIGWNVALDGGGLSHCDGIIQNNGIHANKADYGGAIHNCNGTIQNNIIGWGPPLGGEDPFSRQIYANKADHGGGLAYCAGVVRNNTISWNSACFGGGLSECDASIDDNVISVNSAEQNGGGLYDCDGSIGANLITSNSAGENGDGGGLYRCDGEIRSNIIAGNKARFGAGLAFCRGSIQNNTITGNSAFRGGGVHCCPGPIQNSIVWGNTAPGGAQLWESSEPAYCCVEDWSGDGEGNIVGHPRFLDPDGADDDPETYDDNDYRLLADSPCIDAGDNSLLDPPGLDMDGNLRIAFGKQSLTVDMGAYEYNSVSFAAAQVVSNANGALVLAWNTQPNDTYVVWSCVDLSDGAWMEQAIVPSDGATCSWTDPSPSGPVKFYRIEME